MYLVEVKKTAESDGAHHYFKVLDTIPADKAFQPLADEKRNVRAGERRIARQSDEQSSCRAGVAIEQEQRATWPSVDCLGI